MTTEAEAMGKGSFAAGMALLALALALTLAVIGYAGYVVGSEAPAQAAVDKSAKAVWAEWAVYGDGSVRVSLTPRAPTAGDKAFFNKPDAHFRTLLFGAVFARVGMRCDHCKIIGLTRTRALADTACVVCERALLEGARPPFRKSSKEMFASAG